MVNILRMAFKFVRVRVGVSQGRRFKETVNDLSTRANMRGGREIILNRMKSFQRRCYQNFNASKYSRVGSITYIQKRISESTHLVTTRGKSTSLKFFSRSMADEMEGQMKISFQDRKTGGRSYKTIGPVL
jgi:hypothetical protein